MKISRVKLLALTLIGLLLTTATAMAQDGNFIPTFNFVQPASKPGDVATTLEVIVLLTILTLAPSILLMTTGFLRIIIVLSFVRRALATNEMPPNQVIMGMGLILTFLIMLPTWKVMNENAIQPYLRGEFAGQGGQFKMLDEAVKPMRVFMFEHTRKKDIALFAKVAQVENIKTKADVPTEVLIPAFVISELKRAFVMGFMIFLPFLVIDMVVASILLAMGMMMLPPVMVSFPFKILLFVLVDGWNLITGSLVRSFY